MRVIATAGHVDHGKSALVRALTGMEPDRWEEERRRGLTIDLGFVWAGFGPETIAFVDVPGHQRFVTNMLAGVGPVPAVLFVVAADAGWSRQSSEHLDALQSLGITHSIVAVTKADLVPADRQSEVGRDADGRLRRAGLEPSRTVAVSARTGHGLDELRAGLAQLVAGLPAPNPRGRVRLWVDRVFTVRGAGTVVTGTLGAGQLRVGDELAGPNGRFSIRGLHQLDQAVDWAEATSRVAVNLRGADRAGVHRGDALVTPDAWWWTASVDVLLEPLFGDLATAQMLHIGSAAIPVRVRRLDDRAARLTLSTPLPLQAGDRAVLRDPGQQSVTAGVRVIDPDPPTLRRRGAAPRRGQELSSGWAGQSLAQLARRGVMRAEELDRFGYAPIEANDSVIVIGDWLVHSDTWRRWQHELEQALDTQSLRDPQQPSLAPETLRQQLAIPAPELLRALTDQAGLVVRDGRISRPDAVRSLGRATADFEWLAERWTTDPLYAPERDELSARGLTSKDLATAERTGAAIRLAPELVVAPRAVEFTLRALAELDPPFTLSAARQRLGTTRRVAVPLLELLDRRGHTERTEDGRRRLIAE